MTDRDLRGDLTKSLTKKLVLPLAATVVSAATTYAAKRAPQLLNLEPERGDALSPQDRERRRRDRAQRREARRKGG